MMFRVSFDYRHSRRHHGPEEWWSKNATIEDWFDEMVGIANIINKYAAVRISDIKGRNGFAFGLVWVSFNEATRQRGNSSLDILDKDKRRAS